MRFLNGSVRNSLAAVALVSIGCPFAGGLAAQTPAYHLVARHVLGGDGSWDYVILDTASNRLFIGRQNRVMVVSTAGRLLGEIPGLSAAHGVALDYAAGHGFATSGRDSSVVMFDLKTLKVLGRTTAADDADAIAFDPVSNHVFTFNGDANSSSVIDPVTGRRTATIPLGGKPEYGLAAGDGMLFVNIADKGEVAEIDGKTLRVTRRWSVAPCGEPTGLAIDAAHHRLFSGCRSKVMAISDAAAGKLITTVPIGAGVDANAFDAATGDALSANGDGTLTIIHELSPNAFHVVANVPTMNGARTMALDPRTHRIYTVTAQFGPVPATATADNPRRRAPIVPGTFTLLTLER
jgi:YVTN family beta-propeller protein